MHLIIIKDIEIYFLKAGHLRLNRLRRSAEQCNKVVICKLKVCNYIWRYCPRHELEGKMQSLFSIIRDILQVSSASMLMHPLNWIHLGCNVKLWNLLLISFRLKIDNQWTKLRKILIFTIFESILFGTITFDLSRLWFARFLQHKLTFYVKPRLSL